MARHHSALGGLWLDLDVAEAMIELELSAGRIKPEEAVCLAGWRRDGFMVLPGAVEPDLANKLSQATDLRWESEDSRLRATVRGHAGDSPVPLSRDFKGRAGTKLLDLFWHEPLAREVLLHRRLTAALRLIFRDAPALFQSLSFTRGSQQWLHQDSAYVIVDSPLEMAAAWVALEDWRPGCGELQYFVGSHRIPEFLFGGERKNWSRELDGDAAHEAWARELPGRAERAGCALQGFRPKKGDIFLWHADLIHGGAPVEDPAATRRSIVGHYCPSSRRPLYAGGRSGPRGEQDGAFYSSGVYESEPTASAA